MGQTTPLSTGVLAQTTPPAPPGPSRLSTDPLTVGIALLVAGLLGFLSCRFVLHHHWKQVHGNPDTHPTGAIWTDVLVRLISYVCMLLLAIGLVIVVAKLAGKI